LPTCLSCCVFVLFELSRLPRDLHAFPTRRSSDLGEERETPMGRRFSKPEHLREPDRVGWSDLPAAYWKAVGITVLLGIVSGLIWIGWRLVEIHILDYERQWSGRSPTPIPRRWRSPSGSSSSCMAPPW